jgi:hypothetical protein
MSRIYMPHAGHFIGGRSCVFHLNTYVPTGYIVSTVGEYRPSFSRRHLDRVVQTGAREPLQARGDDEGPEEIGLGRFYETMVFKAVATDSKCCPWVQQSGEDLDFAGYQTADAATEGHEAMCRKWESPQ